MLGSERVKEKRGNIGFPLMGDKFVAGKWCSIVVFTCANSGAVKCSLSFFDANCMLQNTICVYQIHLHLVLCNVDQFDLLVISYVQTVLNQKILAICCFGLHCSPYGFARPTAVS